MHQYPIAAAAFGKGPMEGFVATSGSSINYQYKVVINSLPPPPALQY